MKRLILIIPLVLVAIVISAGALAIGFEFGKIVQVNANSILPSIEDNQTQEFSDRQSSTIPDEALNLYSKNCASCHGPVGEGTTIAPALDNPDLLTRLDEFEIKATIAGGRPGTAMPAWKNRLSDSEINALTSLIQNWGELDIEELSELETQNLCHHGNGSWWGSHPMMGSGCGSGMGGPRWRSP